MKKNNLGNEQKSLKSYFDLKHNMIGIKINIKYRMPVNKYIILLRKTYEITEYKLALMKKLCLVFTNTIDANVCRN